MQRLSTAGRLAQLPGIRVGRAPGFGAPLPRHSPRWGVSTRQAGPGWLKEPAGVLQQLAASPAAEDIPTRQPADATAVVYKLRLGALSEQVAGAYGSQERMAYEQGLVWEFLHSSAYGYDAQQGVNAIVHGVQLDKPGTQQAALVFTACRGNTPAAVRARAATESWVREGLELGGQRLRPTYAPGQQPAGTRRVLLQNLPPALAVKGVVPAVLSCAGYEPAQVQVEAEFLGAVKLQGQVVPGIGCLGNIVAWVASPQTDTALKQLPDQFRVGDSTVRVWVEGRSDSRRHRDFFSPEPAEVRVPQREQVYDPYSVGMAMYALAPERFPDGARPIYDWPQRLPGASPGATAAGMDIDPPTAPPGLGGFSQGRGAGGTWADDQRVAGPAAHPLGAVGLGLVGPHSMDIDGATTSPAPGPAVRGTTESLGATSRSDLGGMHASRRARLQETPLDCLASSQQQGQPTQQTQQQQQQQQQGGHRHTARTPTQGPLPLQQPPSQALPSAAAPAAGGPSPNTAGFDTWAKGAAAKEILSMLGFVLDDLPRVEEAGGKQAAYRAFYGFCTRGPQAQQLLRSLQQDWDRAVPGVSATLPRWVHAWVQQTYGEQGYGSSGSSDHGGSPRGRRRQTSRGQPRRSRAAAAAAAAAPAPAAAAPAARAGPTHAVQPRTSSAQPPGTLTRSGRMSKKPDPTRLYGGGGHA